MIGLLTPPVGTVLYVLSSITKAPTGVVFYGTLPFMIPLLVICGLIIAFPEAVTWLPDQLGL
jgi:TRAP-type C4-dicarboxylate transport system permease large subunit